MKNNSEKQNNNAEGMDKMPSVVLRKCCACGKIFDRNDLIRIMIENKTGKIIINPNNKQFGRSMYLCKNEECFKLAIKKKRLKNLKEDDVKIIKNMINSLL